ncbi:hypothetical protein [Hyphomicrobium sp. GJ21]|uniref:hypothetical protein n=1 Tax=Hyphomicrobium sp. GJ21 TaxID=113574 RepID=UPI00062B7850|nr:hypothetical protein [Hyphomicrobium sp. GJ21]
MQTYIAATQSNKFRVVDQRLFEFWCGTRGLAFTIHGEGSEARYSLTADRPHMTGWPTFLKAAGGDLDIAAELAPLIHPHDIAVLFESSGYPGTYAGGFAKAVHPDGRTVTLALTDIYAKAATVFRQAAAPQV